MTTHIDTYVDESKSLDELRRARVNRTDKQGVVGVPVFLTEEDLERQGIDPEETDEVLIRVEDGFLLIHQVDTGR